jgi:serine/threonine protein kinase
MAPEAVDSAATLFRGRPADVWAMGVTLYCLVFAALPFYHENVPSLFSEIRDTDVVVEDGVSVEVCAILRRLLDKSPASRISLAELWEDNWVTGNTPATPPQKVRLTVDAQVPPMSPLETMISASGPYRITGPKSKFSDYPRVNSRDRILPSKVVARAFYPWKMLRTSRPGDGWGAQLRKQMHRGIVPTLVKETFL